MVQHYQFVHYLQEEFASFKRLSNRKSTVRPFILPKESMAPSTYETFHTLITDVEYAFTTPSNRIKFFALITLCESIVNKLLEIYHIPLTSLQQAERQWLTFPEKLEHFHLLLTSNPIADLSKYATLKFLYLHVRNYIMHGDLLVTVSDQQIDELLQLTHYLTTNYNVDLLMYKREIS